MKRHFNTDVVMDTGIATCQEGRILRMRGKFEGAF
jgi:hypothetical protein